MSESVIGMSSYFENLSRKYCGWVFILFSLPLSAFLAVTSNGQETDTKPSATQKTTELVLPESFDGEEDLEEATRLRINADSVETLKEIIGLAESAIKKGLDKADTEAAKTMIASCLIQKTQEGISNINASKQLSRARLSKLLNEFVGDLGKAIEYDPTLIDAYLLKTEIHAKINQAKEALDSATAGIEKIAPIAAAERRDPDLKVKVSKLYMLRAAMQTEPNESNSDLMESIRLNPNNVAGLAILQRNLIQSDKLAEATAFFRSVLETNPENELLVCSTAELIAQDEKGIAEALKMLNEKEKLLPNSAMLLKTRAKLHAVNKETDLAKADIDKALELSKQDIESLLFRARVFLAEEQYEEAKKDIETAVEIDPGRVESILLRSLVATGQKRFGDAINDILLIIKAQPKEAPKNLQLMMQLGLLYSQDSRPTQAIKVFDEVIKSDEDYWEAYRMRGDTRLTQGDHENAIADFEKALKLLPDDETDRSGILNNMSWVLSTSPNDSIRDGKRALELGLKACELTQYERSHILSTLAAAYAETGDFDKAVEWAEKAVSLSKEKNDEHQEQLEKELKSYQIKKPWREKTETKENKAPVGAGGTGVET